MHNLVTSPFLSPLLFSANQEKMNEPPPPPRYPNPAPRSDYPRPPAPLSYLLECSLLVLHPLNSLTARLRHELPTHSSLHVHSTSSLVSSQYRPLPPPFPQYRPQPPSRFPHTHKRIFQRPPHIQLTISTALFFCRHWPYHNS